MQRLRVVLRVGLCLAGLVPLMGSKCVGDIRDSAISGGLDFVQASAELILNALIPVEETLNPPSDS